MTDALIQTVLAAVIATIRQTLYLADDPISSETQLSKDLELGRVDLIELTLALEKRFKVEFPVNTGNQFRTVSNIVDFLSRQYFHDKPELFSSKYVN